MVGSEDGWALGASLDTYGSIMLLEGGRVAVRGRRRSLLSTRTAGQIYRVSAILDRLGVLTH